MGKLSTSCKREKSKSIQVNINNKPHIFHDAEFDFHKKEVKLTSESFGYLENIPSQFSVIHKYKDGEVNIITKILHLQSLSHTKKQATLSIIKINSF